MDEVKKVNPSKGLIKDINIRALLEAVGDTDFLERVNGVSVSNIINTFENVQVPLDLTKIKRGKGNRKKYLENYIKDADIYVQTSKFEGFGLAIAEARMLNTPVVTTEFDAVYNQMIQGKNGLVVKQDPLAVADAIELLLNDKDLYQEIQEFQKNEKKGNLEEIEKFRNNGIYDTGQLKMRGDRLRKLGYSSCKASS